MGVSLGSREGFAGHGQQSGAQPQTQQGLLPALSPTQSATSGGVVSPWLQGSAPL